MAKQITITSDPPLYSSQDPRGRVRHRTYRVGPLGWQLWVVEDQKWCRAGQVPKPVHDCYALDGWTRIIYEPVLDAAYPIIETDERAP